MTQNNLAFTENELIPEGYKKTEVGIIPNDWSVESLQNLCRSSITYGIVQCGPHIPNGIPYIRVSDMNSSELNVDEMLRTSPEIASSFGRSKVEDGDIVYALRGKLGEVKMVGAAVSGANLTQGTARIAPKNNIDNRYLLWTLRSPQALKQAVKEAKGSTFVEITLGNLKGIGVPLPSSREEQQKIATALSDTDALISELEKLIEKKQAIKTATMQQLLTGKTRLPEFALREDGTPKAYKESELGQIPEDWEVFNLPDVIWYQEGPGLRKWQFQTKGLKVINVTNLQESGYLDLDKTSRHISWDEFEKMYQHFACDEGDMVIASSGNSYCKTSIVRSVDLPLLMNTSVIRFKPLKSFSQAFMYIYLSSKFFKSQIDLLITGGAQPNFGPAHLEKIKIIAPENVEEQSQIGEILLDLENEIKALEIKLNKIKSIKQGMMQELLTGKTRLV